MKKRKTKKKPKQRKKAIEALRKVFAGKLPTAAELKKFVKSFKRSKRPQP